MSNHTNPFNDDKLLAIQETLSTIRLRAGYILGACQGEREMKTEAKEIIHLVTVLEELYGREPADG